MSENSEPRQQVVRNFIDNRFLDPKLGQYFVKDDPVTGRPSLKVPASTREDAEMAIKAAKIAAIEWAKVPLAKRCEALGRIANMIEERFDEFAQIECEDTGKPLQLCRELDVPRAILNFRFFSEFAKHITSQYFDMEMATSYTVRQPLGIVALITPWNLPLYLLTWKLAPALAMGNAVIIKPSELTPQSANMLADVLLECDLPKGLVSILHGPGVSAAEPLIESPEVKAISFTGGTQTGKRVSELAAKNLKKLSLELGGKNPTLIFSDADLKAAAKGVARSSFLNQGQICLCGERILIQKSIYKDFLNLLLEETKYFSPGIPTNLSTTYGALISSAHLKKIESYVQLAKTEGGQILTGGKRPENFEGFFFEATIIDGLSPRSRTAQEEIFGPVITTLAFDTEEEAITMANDVPYGLSATCWTKDTNRARRLGEQIEAGTIWINTWLMRDLRVPFGGLKQSGLGREGGEYSLNFFSEIKTVCTKKDNL